MIEIDAKALSGAMRIAAATVERNSTIPILSNVRLVADGDELELMASDTGVEFRQRLPLKTGGRIDTTVSAERLAKIADTSGTLSFEEADGPFLVKCGRSRFQLPVIGSENYPTLPFEAGASVTIPDLPRIINRLLWARSTEVTRVYLTGPFLHSCDGKLAFAACDGHVAMQEITDIPWPDAHEIIIAPKFAELLKSISGEIELSWTDRMVRAVAGDVTLTAKVIDDKYPDYRRAFPSGGTLVTVDPVQLLAALRRISLVQTDRNPKVKVAIEGDKIGLTVTSDTAGTAYAEVSASCEAPAEICLNHQYLTRMAKSIGGDTLTMTVTGNLSPILFRRTVPDGATGIAMPMRF